MRRKKKELVVAPKCDYCGERSETFVCTADHLTFCRIQYVGHPPIKDCMTDYYEEKKNVQKKRKRKQLMDTTKSRLSRQRKRKKNSSVAQLVEQLTVKIKKSNKSIQFSVVK